jgi:hypothetical protein
MGDVACLIERRGERGKGRRERGEWKREGCL